MVMCGCTIRTMGLGRTKAMRAITPDQDSRAADGVGASRQMKRFDISLLIRHPDLDPEVITSILRLQPHRAWKAGEPRFTPKGTPLSGNHETSSWNHVFRYKKRTGVRDEINNILRD